MVRYLFLIVSLFFVTCEAAQPTVCLSMIVKNEKPVIARCLESVQPIIDTWVIVDTGSTDGTQEYIKELMKNIPGELVERPWVDFAYNRNEALELAKKKADYVLVIDADDYLAYTKTADKQALPPLRRDGYFLNIQYGGMAYSRIAIVKSSVDWKWVGVVHEVLVADSAKSYGTIPDIKMIIAGGGNRSTDPDKYKKDAALLEKAHAENPNETRTVFYLAQSYRDAGNNEKALENYKKRVAMGGWDQEVFWSLYQIAGIQQRMGNQEFIESYMEAYHYRPSRIEPLYSLAEYYLEQGNYSTAYLLATEASKKPKSNDNLFVLENIYEYYIWMTLAEAAEGVGKKEEAKIALEKIVNHPQASNELKEEARAWLVDLAA